MRQAFIADLANPDFPLHRLAKSIPHGYKGQDLLEMLYTKEIPVDRAAWLIQALGAHEVVCLFPLLQPDNES
jgi:mediator of RNA polymerase II transcription subunit 12